MGTRPAFWKLCFVAPPWTKTGRSCVEHLRHREAAISRRKPEAADTGRTIAQMTGETIERDRMRADIERLRQEVADLKERLDQANDLRVADAERHRDETDRLEAELKRARAELAEARRPWLARLWRS